MKKTTLIFVCFLTLASSAFSQDEQRKFYVGLAAGGDINHIFSDLKNDEFTQFKNRAAFAFALPVRYEFKDWLALQGELAYVGKSFYVKHNVLFEDGFEDKVNSNYDNYYFQIPIMAQLSVGNKKWRGFLNAGGYVGYLASSRARGHDYLSYFDMSHGNPWEYGILTGLGVRYQKKQWTFFLETRLNLGLSEMECWMEDRHIIYRNTTYIAQIGIMYDILGLIRRKQ